MMKRRFLIHLAAAVCTTSSWAQTPVPELEELQKQFDANVKSAVVQPFDAGVVNLGIRYVAALERALAEAQKAGNLEQAVAFKQEKESVSLGKGVPTQDDPAAPTALTQLRTTYRDSLAKLAAERDKRAQPMKEAFAKSLDALITKLTKEGKLEHALLVKSARQDINSSIPNEPLATVGAVASGRFAVAPIGRPFVNSLGMKFVPVPSTKVLMCIHETRKRDYAAFAASDTTAGNEWNSVNKGGVPVSENDDHPVVQMSHEDAVRFCNWLSKNEGKQYRLPTDREWSMAVGIGAKEESANGVTPASLNEGLKDIFPWGDNWPPPKGSGNYADAKHKEKYPTVSSIDGYDDGFPTTAPVMSFEPNKLGVFDLSGNVSEWVEDLYDAAGQQRVLRGGAWSSYNREVLRSSRRESGQASSRSETRGFRIVVVAAP